MLKADLVIGRRFTLNTANYSSIQPSVSITIKDVPVEDIEEARDYADQITEGLILKQIEADALTMAQIKKIGFKDFFQKLDTDAMNVDMSKAIKAMSKLGE